MKTFCYFVVIFFILLNNIGLKIETKFEELSPPFFFLGMVLFSIILFSCIVVAIDLVFKIINVGG
ncbi:MAG: hypothetical protein ACTSSF_00295 [Candidatus Heimdallarchaeaceae archaeon]